MFEREYRAFLTQPSKERTFRAATALWQYGRALTASGADTYADQQYVFRQGYVGYRLAEFWPTQDSELQRVRCLVEAGFVLRPEPLPLVRKLHKQDPSDQPIERLLGATLAQTKHFADLAEAQRHADHLLSIAPRFPSYLGLNAIVAHARFNITHDRKDGEEAVRRSERFRDAIGAKTPFGQLQSYIIDLTKKKIAGKVAF